MTDDILEMKFAWELRITAHLRRTEKSLKLIAKNPNRKPRTVKKMVERNLSATTSVGGRPQ